MEEKIKRFNKSAKQLYKDLLTIYPDENILILAKLAFKVFKKLNKSGPCDYYYTEVVQKFKEAIEQRKDSFFLSESLQLPYFEKGTERLQLLWKSCRPEDQETVWDHLNVLMYLAIEAKENQNLS
jgi:hypothetical protein